MNGITTASNVYANQTFLFCPCLVFENCACRGESKSFNMNMVSCSFWHIFSYLVLIELYHSGTHLSPLILLILRNIFTFPTQYGIVNEPFLNNRSHLGTLPIFTTKLLTLCTILRKLQYLEFANKMEFRNKPGLAKQSFGQVVDAIFFLGDTWAVRLLFLMLMKKLLLKYVFLVVNVLVIIPFSCFFIYLQCLGIALTANVES